MQFARSTWSGSRSSSCEIRKRRSRCISTSSASRSRRNAADSTSLEALQEGALGKTSEAGEPLAQEPNADERRRLAQDLVVENGWERAVETALGPYLQAVRIKSLDGVATTLADLTDGGLALIEDEGGTSTSGGADSLLARMQAPPAVAALLTGVRVADSLQAALGARHGSSRTASHLSRAKACGWAATGCA